jgi:hypothetical protein
VPSGWVWIIVQGRDGLPYGVVVQTDPDTPRYSDQPPDGIKRPLRYSSSDTSDNQRRVIQVTNGAFGLPNAAAVAPMAALVALPRQEADSVNYNFVEEPIGMQLAKLAMAHQKRHDVGLIAGLID